MYDEWRCRSIILEWKMDGEAFCLPECYVSKQSNGRTIMMMLITSYAAVIERELNSSTSWRTGNEKHFKLFHRLNSYQDILFSFSRIMNI